MIDRLTTKAIVLVVVLVSAVAILVSGSRDWVLGSIDDAVLGSVALRGKGSDVAPGAMAAALVGLGPGGSGSAGRSGAARPDPGRSGTALAWDMTSGERRPRPAARAAL